MFGWLRRLFRKLRPTRVSFTVGDAKYTCPKNVTHIKISMIGGGGGGGSGTGLNSETFGSQPMDHYRNARWAVKKDAADT